MTAPQQPAPPGTDQFNTAAYTQGQANQANVNQQTIANRANQINPFGSSTWSIDPTTGQWTQNVALTGQQGQALQSQQDIQAGRLGGAAGMVQGAVDSLGHPIDTSGMAGYFNFGGPQQTNQQAQDLAWGQMQPMLQQRRNQMETQLANQGITRGSQAWQQAEDQLARDEATSHTQAIQAGFQQANNMNQQNIAYGDYEAGLRGKQFGEAQTLREQPLSDINALTQGQGVQAPTFGQYGQAGVAQAPNYLGAAQSQYNANLDQLNLSADQKASLMNGLFGLGGAFLNTKAGDTFMNNLPGYIGSAGNYIGGLFGFGGPG